MVAEERHVPEVCPDFWDRVQIRATDECWPWTGNVTQNGYGRRSFDGVQWYAHRMAYTLVKGPIPAGLTVDHLCRHKLCCNPAHLEAVSAEENVRRAAGPRISRDEILDAVRAWARAHGRSPSSVDWQNVRTPSRRCVYRMLGSWPAALDAAGLPEDRRVVRGGGMA